ncbi:MAG: hypothetical protein JWN72_2561 [Thermoleophilia bacterium]|nr:hypothetical protein [Thermoleophilia bacterium]
MKPFAVIACCTFALVVAGCGSGSSDNGGSATTGTPKVSEGRYPDEVRATFMKSCEAASGGLTKSCTSFLDCIEERVSFEDFRLADAALAKGEQAPKSYRDALKPCTAAMTDDA